MAVERAIIITGPVQELNSVGLGVAMMECEHGSLGNAPGNFPHLLYCNWISVEL